MENYSLQYHEIYQIFFFDPLEFSELHVTMGKINSFLHHNKKYIYWLGNKPNNLYLPKMHVHHPNLFQNCKFYINVPQYLVTFEEYSKNQPIPNWLFLFQPCDVF